MSELLGEIEFLRNIASLDDDTQKAVEEVVQGDDFGMDDDTDDVGMGDYTDDLSMVYDDESDENTLKKKIDNLMEEQGIKYNKHFRATSLRF